MGKHKTIELTLRKAKIDEKIVPIVKWLNKQGIITIASCQGDVPIGKEVDDQYSLTGCYIIWISVLSEEPYRKRLKEKLSELGAVTKDWNRNEVLRFRTEWHNQQKLEQAIKWCSEDQSYSLLDTPHNIPIRVKNNEK